jgi:pimeloyl-ACP methyl ester carboxylesterase
MQLHHREIGEGRPFVILHGLFGSSDNWQYHAKRLAEYFRVILIDLRNHGHSPWSKDFSYHLMMEDVREKLEELGIQKCILLGHSMGGKVAMHFAQHYPERLLKLIVVDMGIKRYPMHHQHVLAGIHSVQLSQIKTRGEAAENIRKHIDSEEVIQFILKNLYWKEKGQLAWRMNVEVLEEQMSEILEALPEGEVLTQTLFMKGGLSNYILEEDSEHILDQFPDGEIVTIPNAGHWVHAEAPDAFVNAVLSFCLR